MNLCMIGKSSIKKPMPEKEELYSKLTMQDITDSDYNHAKRISMDFKI